MSVLFENGVQGIILLNIDRKYVIWVFDYQKLKILIFTHQNFIYLLKYYLLELMEMQDSLLKAWII